MVNLLGFIIDAGMLGVCIPIVALMIPIVAILVNHQQRMATIIHGSQAQNVNDPKIDALQEQVSQLQQQMNQFAFALDGIQTAPARSEVRDRIGETQAQSSQ